MMPAGRDKRFRQATDRRTKHLNVASRHLNGAGRTIADRPHVQPGRLTRAAAWASSFQVRLGDSWPAASVVRSTAQRPSVHVIRVNLGS